ncbi:hypothetical protein HCG51_31255 [Tolypothrix sp. PCC 7910]|uniref:hypothetical protein n=1 Tax=Tolypothrix sp. PCC 7910 TaxID=2099387 RepID=UPI00142797F9|nr:hypothetical protein [Tolypothrix sp. PCC 7910]QIR40735.1 hypothetical protein HCG51_31255 [Tolypothrix sp. PCC 7910]
MRSHFWVLRVVKSAIAFLGVVGGEGCDRVFGVRVVKSAIAFLVLMGKLHQYIIGAVLLKYGW